MDRWRRAKDHSCSRAVQSQERERVLHSKFISVLIYEEPLFKTYSFLPYCQALVKQISQGKKAKHNENKYMSNLKPWLQNTGQYWEENNPPVIIVVSHVKSTSLLCIYFLYFSYLPSEKDFWLNFCLFSLVRWRLFPVCLFSAPYLLYFIHMNRFAWEQRESCMRKREKSYLFSGLHGSLEYISLMIPSVLLGPPK